MMSSAVTALGSSKSQTPRPTSRSVTMPTGFSPETTTTLPTCSSRIRSAMNSIDVSGLTVMTSVLAMSSTGIGARPWVRTGR